MGVLNRLTNIRNRRSDGDDGDDNGGNDNNDSNDKVKNKSAGVRTINNYVCFVLACLFLLITCTNFLTYVRRRRRGGGGGENSQVGLLRSSPSSSSAAAIAATTASLQTKIESKKAVEPPPPPTANFFNTEKDKADVADHHRNNIDDDSAENQKKKVCAPLRNVSSLRFQRPNNVGTIKSRYRQCLRFICDWKDHRRCNNGDPTNLDGPEPPCCVHTLRDMAKAFDEVMCELGLEHFVSYGMLLGLFRDDLLIPWTSDNDYIATEHTLAAMMALRPEEKAIFAKHGIHFLYETHFRLCLTPDFMNGKLATNWKDQNKTNHEAWFEYTWLYPFSDIFVAREKDIGSSRYLIDERDCVHPMDTIRPMVRTPVYNSSFVVSMPHHPENVISAMYGPDWNTPDSRKSPHGKTKCKSNQLALLKPER